MTTIAESVPQILADLPNLYRGPGAAVAVLKDGEVVGQQVWGYADLQQGIPMTADTLLPICSITKQMLCGLFTDLKSHPTPTMIAQGEDPSKQMTDQLSKLLNPELLQGTGLSIQHLGNMQSGLRDYWASTVLWGAQPDGHFSIAEHGPMVLERIKSFHFQSGTEYSYSNTNFFLLARVIESVTQQPLGELLKERIFAPAGMPTASLCAHTTEHTCVGYVGDEVNGFYPAKNCIEWAGDAGIVASLADMIGYEQFIDRSRDDPQSWYYTNSEQQTYKDGTPANYGNGLIRSIVGGVATIQHSGAIRGYRLQRLYAPEPRLSIVVMLNQEHGEPGAISEHVLKRTLMVAETKKAIVEPGPDWFGCFLDPETKLAITVSQGTAGELLVKYHRKADKLRMIDSNLAQSDDVIARLDGTSLHVHMVNDNRKIHAQRVAKSNLSASNSDVQGDFHCAEIDSVFHCSGQGGMLYGSFEGFLGKGPVHLMRCLAEDVWALACPQAMDHSPPGDWTILVNRDDNGTVVGVTIGCWLARRCEFVKMS